MEYLQYLDTINAISVRSKVLNLIINGIPSIQKGDWKTMKKFTVKF